MQMRTQAMTSQLISNAVLVIVLALALQVSSASAQSSAPLQEAQPKSRPVIDDGTYSRVLDIVFPRDEPATGGTMWAVVLRFKPNFRPESQLVIKRGANKVEVIEYTPADGSIYAKLNEALERGSKRDAAELAKSIRVTRREVSVPHAQVKQWYAALFDSIPSTTKMLRQALETADSTGAESLVLHGSFYDLWYEQGLNRMSFGLYDVDDARSGGEFKLAQWMDMVRREVEKLKLQ